MSHFSKVKTILRDFDILTLTLTDIGIEWERDLTSTDPNIVIKQKNNFDISFQWNEQNRYDLVADLAFWDQKWSTEVFLSKISQRYAYNLITHESEKQGFQYLKERTQSDGSIHLVLERWS